MPEAKMQKMHQLIKDGDYVGAMTFWKDSVGSDYLMPTELAMVKMQGDVVADMLSGKITDPAQVLGALYKLSAQEQVAKVGELISVALNSQTMEKYPLIGTTANNLNNLIMNLQGSKDFQKIVKDPMFYAQTAVLVGLLLQVLPMITNAAGQVGGAAAAAAMGGLSDIRLKNIL